MKDLIIQLPTKNEIFKNKERLELPLRKDCSTKSTMRQTLKEKCKIYTVLFTDEQIKEMIKDSSLLSDNLETCRSLLFEQALILKFYSENFA